MIDDQDAAIDAWVADYANPRLDAGAGQENYDPALFQTGRDDFEQIRLANDKIDGTLAVAERDARDDSQRAWIAAVVAMVIATLIGLAAVLGLGRSLIRGIQRPLSSLARVVERVAAGQDGVRAQTGEGGREELFRGRPGGGRRGRRGVGGGQPQRSTG